MCGVSGGMRLETYPPAPHLFRNSIRLGAPQCGKKVGGPSLQSGVGGQGAVSISPGALGPWIVHCGPSAGQVCRLQTPTPSLPVWNQDWRRHLEPELYPSPGGSRGLLPHGNRVLFSQLVPEHVVMTKEEVTELLAR